MNGNTFAKQVTVVGLAILLSSCVTAASTTPIESGDNVALGQEAYADGPHVKPVKILEDSRCPMNARCIWAGRVRLEMQWVRPGGNQTFELTLGEPHQLADGAITLTSVRPEKRTDVEIKPSDYRFSFEFQGGI